LPLVENSGLSEYDYVDLSGNPLNSISRESYIPQLVQRKVEVSNYDSTYEIEEKMGKERKSMELRKIENNREMIIKKSVPKVRR